MTDSTTPEPAGDAEPEQQPRRSWPRFVAFALVLAVVWGVAKATGFTDQLTIANMQGWVAGTGAVGVLLFYALVLGLNFIQIPAVPFIILAQLTWGPVLGSVYGYTASLLTVGVVFEVIRLVGGANRPPPKRKWVRNLLAKLDERPVLVIFLLRAIFVANPAVTYALAFTNLNRRGHFLGSALGLLVPVALYAVLVQVFGWTPEG